jgi:GEVED domain/Secretion system C-terminal sorting domain
MKLISTLVFSLISLFSFNQYCVSGGPSSTADSNVESVYLAGTSGVINLPAACPGVVGVQNLTNMSTTLGVGMNFNLYVQFGTCGGNFGGNGEAWIDYDGNGIFNPNESLGTWTGTPPVSLTTMNFTVPGFAVNGVTRMRIIQQENPSTLPLNPCASFTWGSVMDFTINITGGVDCSGYIGDDMADAVVIPSLPYLDTNDNSFCYTNQNLVYNSPDIFYRYILPSGSNIGQIQASLCGSSFDTFLSAITPSGNVLAFNDDAQNCGSSSAIKFNPMGQDTIFFVVEGWGNATGQFILNINSSLVGMDELSIAAIEIIPNPAKSQIELRGYEGPIQIIDGFGRIVLKSEYASNEKINIESLVPGSYFIQMEKGSLPFTKQLIIQ